MNVGSKLAVLVWGIWALCLSLMIPIGAYLYYNTELELTFLITLFSGILIGSLVPTSVIWRTLRESKGKSLESIQREALQGLCTGSLGFGYDQYLFYNRDHIKKARDYLKSYGKFLGVILLYPKKLPEKMDEFLSLHNDFSKNLEKIEVLGKEKAKVSLSKEWLWHYLGLEPVELSEIGEDRKREHKEIAQILEGEERKLVNNTRILHEKLKGMRKEIYEDLENFFKINHLPDLLRYR